MSFKLTRTGHYFHVDFSAHLCTYQPDFISLYCRLSAFVDFFVLVLQQLHRKALSSSETQLCRRQLDALCGFQQRLEEIWRAARWITDVTWRARDRSVDCGLPLAALFAYSLPAAEPTNQCPHVTANEQSPSSSSSSSDGGEDNSDVGYHSDQSVERQGAAPKVDQPMAVQQLVPSAPLIGQAMLENPIYDWPDNLAPTPPESGPLERSSRIYMNLPPSDHVPVTRLISDNSVDCPTDPGSFHHAPIASFHPCVKRTASSSSFLKTQKRYLLIDQYPTATTSTECTSNSNSDDPVKKHEYVNCPADWENQKGKMIVATTDSESAPEKSDSDAAPGRLFTSPSGTVSDTELLNRFRQEQHRRAAWQRANRAPPSTSAGGGAPPYSAAADLSLIDQLYTVAASRARSGQTPSPSCSLPTSPSFPPSPSVSLSGDRACSSRGSSERSPLQAGVLRVYAAYSCGLTRGTSVKLQVTPRTSSREVVLLVVSN